MSRDDKLATGTGIDNPEARAWLSANANPCALAANKFHTTAAALAFVEELYTAGAAEVLIDHIFGAAEVWNDGPYADSLIIRIDDRARSHQDVLDICERAIEGEADGRVDAFAKEIDIWWD